jgi:MFS family permease
VTSTRNRTALFGIVGAIFVSGTGIGSLLPVLPLYLRDRGASYAMVGVIVGAALVAQALGQWPAGLLAERFGQREMMVAGLTIAGLASVAFVMPMPVEWLVVLRFVQGIGFAAATPAELAAIAEVVPPAQLGRAYAWVSGAQQMGFIGGPAIGGLLAASGRSTVFIVTGVALFAAAIVVAVTVRRSVHAAAGPRLSLQLFGRSRAGGAVRAVALLSVGLGLLIGIYDVIWSLYMRSLGASDPLIGASFTLFALPLLIATPFAGWGSDRFDRRWLAVGSIIAGSLIAPIYPLITSIAIVFVVGVFEGAAWAFTTPAMNSFLMDAVPDHRAEAQGVVGTAMSAAMAVGSFIGGWLFSFGAGAPFYVAAAAGLIFALAALPGLRALGGRAPVADERGDQPARDWSQAREGEGRTDAG